MLAASLLSGVRSLSATNSAAVAPGLIATFRPARRLGRFACVL